MIFTPTELPGAFVIDPEPRQDARGWFARTFCAREFEAHGLPTAMVQSNLSLTRRKGTLRGLHFQRAPHEEDKLVRCVRGAVWDVIVDLRPDSPTRGRWIGAELSEDNGRALFVPRGFAHGFLTLSDDAAVCYQMSAYYAPEAADGVRWDDAAFGIRWPAPVLEMSDKDRQWPDYARPRR